MKRVAIIGGGITGIAAALELTGSRQFHVQLLEASDRLGGVLETVREGQYLIERSADNFSTLIPNALELTHQYGAGSDLIRPNSQGRQAFVFLNGKICPIPAGFSLMQPTRWQSILLTPSLTWTGKLRLLAEYWIPPKHRSTASADKSKHVGDYSGDDDESLESFATRRLGKQAFERLVEPIVSGIFTANPKILSMAATMPQFVEMERKYGGLIRGYLASRKNDAAAAARKASGARYDSFVAPKLGMSAWIEKLATSLPHGCVRLRKRVGGLRLQKAPDGSLQWQVELQPEGDSRPQPMSVELYDAVVLATPAATTARLLQTVAPEASLLVGSIQYASSAVIAMVVRKNELTSRIDGFGLVVPRCEQRATLAISYSSNKYPGRVPEDQILLRIFLGGALNPEIVDRTDDQLLRLAFSEVRSILGWTGSAPLWQTVIRWKESMPQYAVGHLTRLKRIEQLLSPFPTLQLCGAAYQGVGIPQCVGSGQAAAKKLIQAIQDRVA